MLGSGVVPKISVIAGPWGDGAICSPATTGFAIMAGGTSTCSSRVRAWPRPSLTQTWIRSDLAERRELEFNRPVPDDPTQPCDMRDVLSDPVGDGDFFGVGAASAPHIVVGFAHLDARSAWIVAQEPSVRAGALDISASAKTVGLVRI